MSEKELNPCLYDRLKLPKALKPPEPSQNFWDLNVLDLSGGFNFPTWALNKHRIESILISIALDV